MFKLSTEIKVGLFMLAVIAAIIWASFHLEKGKGGWFQPEGYHISVLLESAEGLRKDSFVKMAGIPVGYVKGFEVDNGMARVTIEIFPDVVLHKDLYLAVKTKGILGDRYIEITSGTPDAPIMADGDEVINVEDQLNVDEILNNLSSISSSLRDVSSSMRGAIGTEAGKERLNFILEDIQRVTHTLRKLIEESDPRVREVIGDIKLFSDSLSEKFPRVIEGIDSISKNLGNILEDNRQALKVSILEIKKASQMLTSALENVSSITERVERGEGTLGKLIKEETLANKFYSTIDDLENTIEDVRGFIENIERIKIYLDYHGEYNALNERRLKNYVGMDLRPREDKFFRFQVVHDPEATRIWQETIEKTSPAEGEVVSQVVKREKPDEIRFSVEIGKRFGFLTLRGGILESTGGFGTDIHLLEDDLTFSFEAFDMGREENPHLKARGEYSFLKYLYITAGVDDFISSNDDNLNLFLGAGIRFEDRDIKGLLPFIPSY